MTGPIAQGPDEPGPPAAQPAESSRKPASRLAIALVVGGVIVVALGVVAIVLVLFGQPSGEPAEVADISSEPTTTWKYDWVGSSEAEYLDDAPIVVAAGEDRAIVFARFDTYAYAGDQGAASRWYPGYDEHYTDGYAAGLQYKSDYDAYVKDTYPYSLELPQQASYFPPGAYADSDTWLGFHDGFYDAAYSLGEGASKRVKPADPDYEPSITMLDATNGEPVWTVELADVVEDADFSTTLYAYDITGSNAVAVTTTTTDDEGEERYAVTTLNRDTGERISQRESEGPQLVSAFDGDLIIASSGQAGSESTVDRYDVNALDDTPQWSTAVDGSVVALSPIDANYLNVVGERSGTVIKASSGDEADFGAKSPEGTSFVSIGGHLVQVEAREGSTVLTGIDEDGAALWARPVTADFVDLDHGLILIASTAGAGFSRLQRVDPENGTVLWGAPNPQPFESVLGVRDDAILLRDEGTVVAVDATSGMISVVQEVGDFQDVYTGDDLYYVSSPEDLSAYRYDKKGERWTFALGEDEGVLALSTQLALNDFANGRLHGLAAR